MPALGAYFQQFGAETELLAGPGASARAFEAVSESRKLVLIIACTSCPAQYSVPDARVRGKKVRLTCKHCAAGIIVDATADAPLPQALPRVLPLPSDPELGAPSLPEEDVTLIARPKSKASFSVHDEPTVIGQIPREALEFERRFAQRTLPPPAEVAPAEPPVAQAPATEQHAPPPSSDARDATRPVSLSQPPGALPELPESADDETKRASPRAFGLPTPVPPPPEPLRDDRTLISGASPSVLLRSPAAASQHRWRATLVVALVLAAMVALFVRQQLH